jgi:ABC-type taurine transport system ATPase subunit
MVLGASGCGNNTLLMRLAGLGMLTFRFIVYDSGTITGPGAD